jgi:hypothetical protein
MNVKFSVTVFFLFTLCNLPSLPTIEAYYYGAGSCPVGMAGVGPPHKLNMSPTFNTEVATGTLLQGGFTVFVDSKALVPHSTTKVAINKNHVISIKAASSKVFRGFLIRLNLTNASALKPLSGATTVQVASVCQSYNAVGLTHTLNTTKVGVSGNLLLQRTGNVALDVTIVVKNRQKTSIYYYSGFTLNGVKG